MNFESTEEFAKQLDERDPLGNHRENFNFPKDANGDPALYFAGHSLGLMPKKAKEYVDNELSDWASLGVEGHFKARNPWLPYHEFLTENMAQIVGGKNEEVVVMNTLTVNLHLMMVSFYRPTKDRFKILIENNTFPSDKYAVDSQARFHGFDPREAVIESDSILQTIEENKDQLAMIMLGNVNYLSGRRFDFEQITKLAHKYEIQVGFNLAHGAGNLELKLHDWNVDFAVWCSYKYLNSGPGGIAGCFVHENHLGQKDIPRFEGWWGHKKEDRFKMGPHFEAIPTVEAWQLSNPPIFQLASLKASLELFHEAGLSNIFAKRDQLTSYLEFLINKDCSNTCEVLTPPAPDRGSMLCIRVKGDAKSQLAEFESRGVICDFREPDILRIAPIAQYTKYHDVYRLVKIIEETLND